MNEQIPIVAMTANAMDGEKERCIAAGMNDFITKPVDNEIVIRALHRWLPETAREGWQCWSSFSSRDECYAQVSRQMRFHRWCDPFAQ